MACVASLVLLQLTPATSAGAETDTEPANPLRLIVTQLPVGTTAEKGGARADGMLPADWGEGARLVLVEDGALARVFTEGFASAADPDVSLDGRRVLFAGKRRAGDRWALYEMGADGSDAREILATSDDLRQPVAFPTVHTIVPDPTKGTEPRAQIGFVRTFAGRLCEHGDAPATALFTVRPDGSQPRRLTASLSNEASPAVLRDGRVVFSSWQHASPDHGPDGRFSLLSVQADGLDPAVFSADEGARIKAMPCMLPTAARLVAFVESQRGTWDGAGPLACVSLRSNLHSHRRITADGDGLFHSPSALPDGTLAASRRPSDGTGTHGVVRVDPASGRVEALFDDPNWHDLQARALAPRVVPDDRSTAIADPDHTPAGARTEAPVRETPQGKLYGLDVSLNDLGPDVTPGTIRRLRIIEGLPRLAGTPPSTLSPRRLVGEIPVEADGSFQVRVPADVPLQLQILDADGLALRSSGWIWTRPRGQQGCIGCHEDGELAPTNRFIDALRKPAPDLVLAPERRRSVDFVHDIAPVVAARCASCHGRDARVCLTGDDTFDTLLRFADPGRARTSRIVWHLLGRNTARPWDGAAATQTVRPSPSEAVVPADERRLFAEWIDLGALREVRRDAGGAADATEPAHERSPR